MITAKFWGVRGSVPTPLTPKQIEAKIKHAFEAAERGDPWDSLSFEERSTYGGNTTCVEVQAGSELFILDMGTGVRELGKQQMGELLKTSKLSGTILQSHVHWDHIQGIPFWAPLYLPRRQFDCQFEFYGGKQWDSQLDLVYRGQMNPPVFPVNLEELEQSAMNMRFQTIFDGWSQRFGGWAEDDDHVTNVLARKLLHPQETFGYRINHGDRTLVFTTDHEPYAAGIPRGLAELVQGADVWVTDLQYSHDDYTGKTGPQRLGWGHSFPEYIATVARECQPKRIVTTHHDPDSSDDKILALARKVQDLSGIETVPAFEGLTVTV